MKTRSLPSGVGLLGSPEQAWCRSGNCDAGAGGFGPFLLPGGLGGRGGWLWPLSRSGDVGQPQFSILSPGGCLWEAHSRRAGMMCPRFSPQQPRHNPSQGAGGQEAQQKGPHPGDG